MISIRTCCAVAAVAAASAIALRLPHLDIRPMHTDEAVHAYKMGRLLEEGYYRYDINEYHGPTLNYFTLLPAVLKGQTSYAHLAESTLRIVPVFFGVVLVFMPLFLLDGLGRFAVAAVSVLTALSPAFVFYSRYYIQEILLVFFTFAFICCVWRYLKSQKLLWIILAGVSAGLMHATKETCIIAFGSMLIAVAILSLAGKGRPCNRSGNKIVWRHILIAIAVAVFTSALFYSSFFTNLPGVLESYLTYGVYFDKAAGKVIHFHPWYYYLDILTYVEFVEKLSWNEDIIVVLSVVGFWAVFFRKKDTTAGRGLCKFIALYTLIMLIVYSAIPYKTPWSMLSFLHGMILLAGIGAAVLVEVIQSRLERIFVFTLLIIFAVLSPAVQSFCQNFYFYADPSNPYVYAHTSTDIYKITSRIESVTAAAPSGNDTYIQVICEDDDYWPLPWYLRKFNRVGYDSKVVEDTPSSPLIIACPSFEQALIRKLYTLPPPGQRNMYLPLFDDYVELRPGVELRGYIDKRLFDLWEAQNFQPVSNDARPN